MLKDETMCAENTELAPYFFHQGTNFYAYRYLGVHRMGDNAGNTYAFRTWAPNAARIFVIGDFNGWQESNEMHRVTDGGVFELILDVLLCCH